MEQQGVPKRGIKIQTPEIHPKEIIQNLEDGESFKSGLNICVPRDMGVTLIINVATCYITRTQ